MYARVPGTRAAILLREEQFALVTRLLGCQSDAARARLLGCDPKTIRRVREGVIGEEFIAKTVALLQRHADELARYGIEARFETVFHVGEKKAAA